MTIFYVPQSHPICPANQTDQPSLLCNDGPLTCPDALSHLLPDGRLQCNVVTRCANLLPAFELVSQRGERKPLALIEIGASAGLNLYWDLYHYRYGHLTVGNNLSPVHLHCTLKGRQRPGLPTVMPEIASRVGIDFFPLDVTNEQHVSWLSACIRPEETERFRAFTAALQFAQEHSPRLLAGDACHLLPDLLDAMPPEATICLWHSYALAQGPACVYQQIVQLFTAFSRMRCDSFSPNWPRPGDD